MTNLIDHLPRRWQRPLGEPMKYQLNEMYDKVMQITDMYIEKDPAKERYQVCESTVRQLEKFAEWIYLYWIIAGARNSIKPADDKKRDFMCKMFNRQIYLLAKVMDRLDTKRKYGEIKVTYKKPFNVESIKGIVFLEKLYALNELVYPKTIRIPEAKRDEEVTIACRYIRNAFYTAYTANCIMPMDADGYKKRKRLFGEAVSDLYRLDRPMLKLFMVHLFSDEDMEEITNLINDSTKILQAVQNTDKERFGHLLNK